MMKTTMTIATNLHCSPFEVFAQDCDEVIMMINFYLMMSDHKETVPTATKKAVSHKEQRIRVNDKTATGGWF